jgi:pSer/pThr/pTyr-binding forkhead associated (FHA) protein
LVAQTVSLVGRVDEVSGIYPDVDLTPHGGEEGGVSRRHAELRYEGGVWFAIDLDSTNGTFVNGVELQPKVRTPLSDGDRLALGELEISFHS